MIEIKIPKEITEYKEKFLFGLTVRQFFSVAAALGVCVPLFIFGKDFLGEDVASWLVIFCAIPIFGFGFVKFNGLTFEQLLAILYRQKWKEPQKRKYIELPVFYEWREEMISNELAHQREFAKFTRRKASQKQQKTTKSYNKKKVYKCEKDQKGNSKQRKGNRQKALGKAEKETAKKECKEKG